MLQENNTQIFSNLQASSLLANPIKPPIMKKFSFVFIAFAFTVTAFAQSPDYVANIWLGTDAADAQNWHNAHNWSKGHVPTPTETVLILDSYPATDAVYPVISEQASVGVLKVHPHANLTIADDVTLTINGNAVASDFNADNVFALGKVSYQLADETEARYAGVLKVKFCETGQYYCTIE